MTGKTTAAIAATCLVLGGAAGFWPQYQRRVEAERQLAAARQDLEVAKGQLDGATSAVRLSGLLGQSLVLRDLVAGQNYGLAQQHATRFFDAVREEAARTAPGSVAASALGGAPACPPPIPPSRWCRARSRLGCAARSATKCRRCHSPSSPRRPPRSPRFPEPAPGRPAAVRFPPARPAGHGRAAVVHAPSDYFAKRTVFAECTRHGGRGGFLLRPQAEPIPARHLQLASATVPRMNHLSASATYQGGARTTRRPLPPPSTLGRRSSA